VIKGASPSQVVLFAVGGGGHPERHRPLLTALADSGCTVVAPHFERLVTHVPNDHLLLQRARRLRLALDAVASPGLPVAGVGHSLGAAMLLALAGGQMWTRAGQRLAIETDHRLKKLVLLAPATDFFLPAGSLDAVCIPILAWAGTRDTLTPPAHAERLKPVLAGRARVEVHIVDGAGHFSFMNDPPPGIVEPLPDRDGFLLSLTDTVRRFITSPQG
jgi:pimeloyl-ACP methyl ester carboxylesterase